MLGERAAQEAMAPALQARRRSAQPRRRHPTMPRAARESPRRARSCSGARRPDSPGTPHADAARAILTEGSRPLFPFLLRPGPPSSIGLGPKHSGPSDCRGFPVPTRKEDKEPRWRPLFPSEETVTPKLRQENETLHQPKAMYFDFQFAKAEAYYYRRHQETVLGEAWKYKMVPGWEIKIERERDHTVKTQEMLKNGTV
ncbi:uncharacterized protein LOC109492740 isoform X2 [Felis catus]|uniref:uncharacterized protein LOC109492740 isoform X2 n=1 Tax=Felis catus TaxID=9685 RepID=UPI001D19CC5A|nr:uncharacterized protein LOC109492740 isoform X2 [Felis catus]